MLMPIPTSFVPTNEMKMPILNVDTPSLHILLNTKRTWRIIFTKGSSAPLLQTFIASNHVNEWNYTAAISPADTHFFASSVHIRELYVVVSVVKFVGPS